MRRLFLVVMALVGWAGSGFTTKVESPDAIARCRAQPIQLQHLCFDSIRPNAEKLNGLRILAQSPTTRSPGVISVEEQPRTAAAIAEEKRAFENGVAAYERGDYATAMRLWRPLADRGNGDAQYNLGVMYDKGLGVRPNDAVAAS
jgi:TolA-binding protein